MVRLAVTLCDLDRIDSSLRAKLVSPNLDLLGGVVSVTRLVEKREVREAAIVFKYGTPELLLTAAAVCDQLREMDLARGDNPTGVWLHKGTSWTRLTWNAQLTVVVFDPPVVEGGETEPRVTLNPEVFGSTIADVGQPIVAAKPVPPPAPVPVAPTGAGAGVKKWGK